MNILKDMSMLNGIPGNEKEVRNYMKLQMDGFAEVSFDNLGSIIGEKIGAKNGPKIMVAGHMDEVGFMVTTITDEGYVKFTAAGGWWSQVMLAQQLNITTSSGAVVRGVIGAKAPHILTPEERKKPVEIKDMFIDVGVDDKDAAIALGIKPGDMVTPYIEYKELSNPKYLLGKAWDNRVGCAAAIEVLQQLQDTPHPNRYYAVGTVMEEVGLRGAATSAHKINPDIGIALDTTIAFDFPGGNKNTQLGKGVGIMFKDSSMVGHKGLRDYTVELCEKHDIPYQLTYLERGGTDGGAMHLATDGAPSIALCLPVRYLHSHTSIVHKDDYDAMVKLVVKLVETLDQETVHNITYER
ncbi:M42 family metallopeptidase [Candidatus Xianfuyuplasma coldseepsis]|uniref:M42 family metallopeptidase n=1 Tax=Candidatus Xianfuyuplasma coldseepsis TaxID=2782163 RepID=A0A7L7KSZ4_9MOLU|nr:M42 family metallopeptidase [Xianfuyuplasma coldseepsis]QMS85725.1 M42 family metallopeptidase [Xianfuyuplasma coldseepsis]